MIAGPSFRPKSQRLANLDRLWAMVIGQITAQLGSLFDMPQGVGSQALGRVKQKQLPSPGSPELSAQICPCIASINRLLM